MPTTTQKTLPLQLICKGKSASLSAARMVLGDVDDWALQAMIEDGRLSWVINVASKHATARELRIPLCCLDDFQRGLQRDYPTAEIAEFLFGKPAQVAIKARKFYRALNMKHSHFYDTLVAEGSLRLAPGSQQRRGPGGSAFITWLDAITFLTSRRVL